MLPQKVVLDYVLELPTQAKDAKRRGLSKDIAKLLVMTEAEKIERESFLLGLGELIYVSRRKDEVIHAVPLSSFVPVEDYKNLLIEKHIECYLDTELDDIKKKPKAIMIECDTKEKCFFVLNNIDAEAILFYSVTKNKGANKESEKRLMEASVFGYDEKIFLKELGGYGFFTFFAESHMSLEILGMESSIIACFMKFLELEGRLPKMGS